jgi:antitoxin component YwqK of YwqJK toxin-antitoxin module
MKHIFLYWIKFLPIVFIFHACTQTIVKKDEDGHIYEKFTIDKKTKTKNGDFTRYFANGNVAETAFYKNDRLEGERKILTQTGQTEIIEHYLDGKFQGEYKAYFLNGKLKQEGTYTNGEMTGKWKGYYDTGELKEIVTFEHNLENGAFTEFHKNGNRKTEGIYNNGDFEQGELHIYDEAGALIKLMDCESGICRTRWSRKDI